MLGVSTIESPTAWVCHGVNVCSCAVKYIGTISGIMEKEMETTISYSVIKGEYRAYEGYIIIHEPNKKRCSHPTLSGGCVLLTWCCSCLGSCLQQARNCHVTSEQRCQAMSSTPLFSVTLSQTPCMQLG